MSVFKGIEPMVVDEEQAARMLGISRRMVFEFRTKGELQHVKFCTSMRIANEGFSISAKFPSAMPKGYSDASKACWLPEFLGTRSIATMHVGSRNRQRSARSSNGSI